MTTLNAKANTAYQDLIAKTERENPGDVWAGFDGDQDAFETGFETGHKAAMPTIEPNTYITDDGDGPELWRRTPGENAQDELLLTKGGLGAAMFRHAPSSSASLRAEVDRLWGAIAATAGESE